jgi:CRP/FNR family cyclic AMP-dependent transcriptional regulator
MGSLTDFLDGSTWFAVLTEGQQARVSSMASEITVLEGSVMGNRGEAVDNWFGVIDGLLKVHNDSVDGRSVSFTSIPPGGWVGEGSLLRKEPRRYGVIALRTSRVALVPRATFEWLLDESIPFNRFLLDQLNERLAQFIATVEYQRLLDTDQRIASCIAELFNQKLYPNFDLRLAISQEEIGFLVGASRQRVNKALRQFEERGFLQVWYGGITVLNLEALKSYSKVQ